MSASLVGSEMCIRDRQTSLAGEGGAIRRRGGGEQPGEGLQIHGGLGRFPVSYTHLTLPTICSV
eukprot:7742100-Alexandrium_andersonii.AAC.1